MTDMQLHRELAMNDPIITRESHPIEYRETTREWTYDEILEVFPDDDGSLVNPLVRRCQRYEAEIERLKKELGAWRQVDGFCPQVIRDDEP